MQIVHIDARSIVVDKPAGLLAVPGRTEPDCVLARLQVDHPEALVVHRLDQATSGLLLFARTPEAQREFSADFAERRIAKRYVALVRGDLPESGQCDLPLMADWPRRPLQKVDVEHGKPSTTRWRVLTSSPDGIRRVELEPVTGRSHQLRVHLLALGCPIVGDALYGGAPAHRLMLHATWLRLADGLQLHCPPPF
ncbi:MAG: RluA family pseudouridine synthase [Paucibacter sp.]|nr:RluA family pseudouridine synthase [Roseateles sp.]